MSVQLQKSTSANQITTSIQLTNIITNGKFDTLTGWITQAGVTLDSSQKKFGTNSVKFPAHASNHQLIRTSMTFVPEVGHKYYGREYIKTPNGDPSPADCRFEIFGGDGNGKNWIFNWNKGNFSDWTINSGVVTINTLAVSSYYIRTFGVAPGQDFYLDGLMVIDLTEAFGEGKEPSKEWCDTNIPFFEGTQVVQFNINERVYAPQLVEITGNNLVNLLTDPIFTNGRWSGGTYDSTHVKYGTRALKITATGTELERTIPTTDVFPLINTHIYYARWEGYQEVRTNCGGSMYWPIAEPCFGGNQLGPAGQWFIVSSRNTRQTFTDGSYGFRVDFDNNKQAGTIWVDGCMLIDLTAAFGAGNEPSKEWCDSNIPFFEGSLEIDPPDNNKIQIFQDKIKASIFEEDITLPVAMRIKGNRIISKMFSEIQNADLDLRITSTKIDFGNVNNGESISYQYTSNQSGVEWFLALGKLPTGMSISTSGKLSGSSTEVGTKMFTIGCKKGDKIVTQMSKINIVDPVYTITFNANGGSCSVSSKQVKKYDLIGTLPEPTLSGKVFQGWFTSATGGLPIDETYTVLENMTLYARYGVTAAAVEWTDFTKQFNIQYNGDRTNYNNNPYTLYALTPGTLTEDSNIQLQTGVQSQDGSSNMTDSNREISLMVKVTNNGEAGYFDIGFDCDSYVAGSDSVVVTRIPRGVQLGSYYTVTVDYEHTAWVGGYNSRTSNRQVDSANGAASSGDSGYAFTIKNVFVNKNSYTILEVVFQKL